MKATAVDVVVMDVQFSEIDAIDLIRSIASSCHNTQTLALMSTADWRVRPTMRAGAMGVLLKNTAPKPIAAALVPCTSVTKFSAGTQPGGSWTTDLPRA